MFSLIFKMFLPLFLNVAMSFGAYYFTVRIIPRLKDMFLKANLFGIDLNKQTKDKVPEALGVVTGSIFLVTMFLFIPLPFSHSLFTNNDFPHDELVKLMAALLSICCMLLLGFADDVLDLRWRHKLLLPTIASLPLLMVYYVTFNATTIIVPKPMRSWLGFSLNLGPLYYIYMGMLAVFCTNAINILAGVNGLEVGQSVVIASSIALFNVIELSGALWQAHVFSLYFLFPYIATSLGLLKYNWYPSRVFVGDTFCYFSGMTFAVVGILGHFSKTMLLFFIPQVFNFLYSVPQLFHLVPCPRHRMPRLNLATNKLEPSVTLFKQSDLKRPMLLALRSLGKLGLVRWRDTVTPHPDSCGRGDPDDRMVECNNLTLINLLLILLGPMNEAKLTTVLITIQVMCSVLAFAIRYPLASLFYDVPGPQLM
ncbi:hypothetical protein FOCC_FOCC000666 [Frankliniella occidentalis]|uniref:UDP-N-acetylglucosamine--dolichyl-phosphate N-acetylglucosaminephosphotransferase n=1 Tax=Frankliniella occidentalis TaxID=133901 RepID=A0A6J1RSM7_FRAOC|nr:UDP-N-acetylglucosamine--dolichyl-phosphate N-acetylglucosaminephosphotransferase [Frankliniella occidentalis]KAE8752544.1 hypothetical protein FOCC_FOCC000666 [Frankliniella occidentalis]